MPTDHAEVQSSRIEGTQYCRIRKLKDFAKHHTVPDSVNEATKAFVRRISQSDVQRVSDALYQDVKTLFGYKRREMGYLCEDGFARLSTPDFVFQTFGEQCNDDCKMAKIVSEVTELKSDIIADNPSFHSCFNNFCDRVVIDFLRPIDVESKIDRIEDLPELEPALAYEPDGSRFELKLPDLDLLISVDELSMTVSLLTLRNLAKLLDHSQKAFDILSDCGLHAQLSN